MRRRELFKMFAGVALGALPVIAYREQVKRKSKIIRAFMVKPTSSDKYVIVDGIDENFQVVREVVAVDTFDINIEKYNET